MATKRDKAVESEMDKRHQQDLTEIVRLVLSSPLKRGEEIIRADGEMAMEELSEHNTDVQTRIVMQMAYDAAKGDVKAAEFLLKAGDLNPAERREITLDVPQLIDDMTDRLTPAPPSPLALGDPDEEDERSYIYPKVYNIKCSRGCGCRW
jgi:hypothetical protein